MKENKGGISLYFRKIFSLMFLAIGVTALTSFISIHNISLIVSSTGNLTPFFYIMAFGGLAVSLFAQYKAFTINTSTAIILFMFYAVSLGFTITPLIAWALSVNPVSILQAFVIASLMFACMALFGYKTVKDLSFLGTFLFIGMIGLFLVGIVSMFWPLGNSFSMIVSLCGVLIFALFTAYDMNTLKNAYYQIGDKTQADQMAVLGALHLYISLIAMFQYILNLLNRGNR